MPAAVMAKEMPYGIVFLVAEQKGRVLGVRGHPGKG